MNKRLLPLFILAWLSLFLLINATAKALPNETKPTIPTYNLGQINEESLTKLLQGLYPTPHNRPPIVLVHGWQGANIGLECQRHDAAYVDANWANIDEYLSTGADLEEPVGSGNLAFHRGLGFYVEIARLYSGGAISADGPGDPNWHCTPVAEENVPNLMEAIDAAKAATGQPKVILIAHSMGGLVSRAYLESSFYRDDVAAVFTLGTPHMGVPVNVLQQWVEVVTLGLLTLEDYCEAQPAVCQFADNETDPGYPAGYTGIETFNAVHNQRATGVYYHMHGGDAAFEDRGWFGALTDAIITGPDDGIVPLDSALGISSWDGRLAPLSGPIDRLFVYPAVHIDAFADDPNCVPPDTPQNYYTFHEQDEWVDPCLGSDYLNRYIPPISYLDCLEPILDGRFLPHTCGTVSTLPAHFNQQPPLALSPAQIGKLTAGETAVHDFWLEGGEAILAVHTGVANKDGHAGTLSVSLIAPNGQIINPAYVAAHPDEVRQSIRPADGLYWLGNAMPGQWQIVVTGGDDIPAGGLPYVAKTISQSSVHLHWQTDQPSYHHGDTATLTVAVEGGQETAVTAQTKDGLIPLTPAGNNTFTAQLPIHKESGYMQVTLTANGRNTAGDQFSRTQTFLLPVASADFALNGRYQDSLAPALNPAALPDLLITVGVTAQTAGSLGLTADLVDKDGRFLTHANTSQTVPAGSQELVLRFRGADLAQSTGPYTLSNVRLLDYTAAGIVVAEAEKAHETAVYTANDFQLHRATAAPITTSDDPHSCTINNPGPYQPGQTISLNFSYNNLHTDGEYPELLDSYFINAPDAWHITSQSPNPTDQSGWNRPMGAIACNDTSTAYWGLLNNPHLAPLTNPCQLSLTNLPLAGSFNGPWFQAESYTAFSESFEGNFPPPGWQMVIEDGATNDDPNHGFEHSNARTHSGGWSAYHHWSDAWFYEPTPRSWLVSPALTIKAGDQLTFWQNDNFSGDYDTHYLYIGRSGDTPDGFRNDPLVIYDLGPAPEDAWGQVSIDLTEFAGRTDVRIAFYYEGDNADGWYIDDFAITSHRQQNSLNTFSANYQVGNDNLCPGSAYVGVSFLPTDPRSGLVGVALGDLVDYNVNTASCNVSQTCPLPTVSLTTSVSTNGICPGSPSVTVPADAQNVTFCASLTNSGNAVTVVDHTLTNTLIANESFSVPLAPGQTHTVNTPATLTGTQGNCYTNVTTWTAVTPLGLGQVQGSGPDTIYQDTTYTASSNATTTVCVGPAQPQINVQPSSLSQNQFTDVQTSQPFTITNPGGLALNWSVAEAASNCATPGNVTWLTASPTSGTTLSNTVSVLDVTFDSTGLPPSTNSAFLCLASNAVNTPLVALPVTLEVLPWLYGVELSPDTATSGLVSHTITYTVSLTNTGNITDVFELSLSGANWPTTLSASSLVVDAGAQATVAVAVDIPANAANNATDTAILTAVSQNSTSDSTHLTTTAVVLPVYHFALSGNQALSGTVGTVVTYTFYLTNSGNVPDTYALTLAGNQWSTTNPNTPLTLNAGQTTAVRLAVTVPLTATHAASDTAHLLVSAQSNAATEERTASTTAVHHPPAVWQIYLAIGRRD